MANNFSSNLRILVGKLESVAGTMETLTAGDFDVRVRSPELTITVEVDDEASKWANGNHGEDQTITGAQTAQVTFSVKAATASAVTAEPKWWKFAKGCGLASAAWASAGYGLTPKKANDEVTMTLWVYDIQRGGTGDAVCTKIAGAMGNMVLNAEGVGKPWVATFTFTGKVNSVVDVLAASVPAAGLLDATCADRLLMDSVYVNAVAQKISTFSLDLGNEIQPVYDQSDASGISHYGIVSRKPRLSINPLMVSLATDNVYSRLHAGATGCPSTYAMHIGDTGANTKYAIMVPKGQMLTAGVAAREGLQAWEQNYKLLGNGVTGAVSDANLTPEVTFEILSGARS